MKFGLVITLNFCLCIAVAQKQLNSHILWNDTVKLEWKDYKKVKVGLNPNYEAATTVVVYKTLDTINGKIHLRFFAAFSKDLSWVVKDKQSPELLEHERLHFVLCEIYARILRKKLMNLKVPLTMEILEKEMKENRKLMDKENETYDVETKHGLIMLKQKEWSEKIKNKLKELEKYKLK